MMNGSSSSGITQNNNIITITSSEDDDDVVFISSTSSTSAPSSSTNQNRQQAATNPVRVRPLYQHLHQHRQQSTGTDTNTTRYQQSNQPNSSRPSSSSGSVPSSSSNPPRPELPQPSTSLLSLYQETMSKCAVQNGKILPPTFEYTETKNGPPKIVKKDNKKLAYQLFILENELDVFFAINSPHLTTWTEDTGHKKGDSPRETVVHLTESVQDQFVKHNNNKMEVKNNKRKAAASDMSSEDPVPAFKSSKVEYNPFERLLLSLLSPEPLTVPRAQGMENCLQFSQCEKILDALLAHSGVFSDCGLRELFEVQSEILQIEYSKYWNHLMKRAPDNVRELQCDFFNRTQREPSNTTRNEEFAQDPQEKINSKKRICCQLCACSQHSQNNDSTQQQQQQSDEDDDDEDKLFAAAPSPCTQATKWRRNFLEDNRTTDRFFHISCILKNASYSQLNAKLMANHLTTKRYILLSLHSSNIKLSRNALMILDNVSGYMKITETSLDDPMIYLFIQFVQDGLINSVDRFIIMYCIDIVKNWFSQRANVGLLEELLRMDLYGRLHQILLIKDMLLFVKTLDCICAITSLSGRGCDLFASIPGFIKTLITLLTSQRDLLGTASLIGLKACLVERILDPDEASAVDNSNIPNNRLPSIESAKKLLKQSGNGIVRQSLNESAQHLYRQSADVVSKHFKRNDDEMGTSKAKDKNMTDSINSVIKKYSNSMTSNSNNTRNTSQSKNHQPPLRLSFGGAQIDSEINVTGSANPVVMRPGSVRPNNIPSTSGSLTPSTSGSQTPSTSRSQTSSTSRSQTSSTSRSQTSSTSRSQDIQRPNANTSTSQSDRSRITSAIQNCQSSNTTSRPQNLRVPKLFYRNPPIAQQVCYSIQMHNFEAEKAKRWFDVNYDYEPVSESIQIGAAQILKNICLNSLRGKRLISHHTQKLNQIYFETLTTTGDCASILGDVLEELSTDGQSKAYYCLLD